MRQEGSGNRRDSDVRLLQGLDTGVNLSDSGVFFYADDAAGPVLYDSLRRCHELAVHHGHGVQLCRGDEVHVVSIRSRILRRSRALPCEALDARLA